MATQLNVSAAAPIPAHVPPERVHDFDFVFDPRLYPDPHLGMRALIKDAPSIFYTPRHGGHWVITEHEAAWEFVRNPEVFSSRFLSIPKYANETPMFPINLDAPEHTKYRTLLAPAFSPKRINQLEDSIRKLTRALIAEAQSKDICDFYKAVAEPLPVYIFMELMGLPFDRFGDFRRLTRQAFEAKSETLREEAFAAVLKATEQLIHARQIKRENDLISSLLDAKVDGRPLNFEELQSYCLLLFLGGLDTVVNAIAFGARHLAHDSELQDRLRREPGLIPAAVEELLRLYPIALVSRCVMRNYEYRGVRFRPDDMILILQPAGNLDARVYADPEHVDLQRRTPHMTFNAGPHRCIGSHLARLELRVVFEEWLRAIPAFRLDPEHASLLHPGRVLGVDALPMVLR